MGKNKSKFKYYNKSPRVDDYVPVGKTEDLDRKIEDLKLSTHCYEALVNGKVVTLRDLCKERMTRMYRIQNIGKRDCLEIAAKLKTFGLAFRPEEEKVSTPNGPQQNNQRQNNPNQQKQNQNQNQPKQNQFKQNQQNNNQNNNRNNNQPIKNNLNFSIFDDKKLVEFLEGERQKETYVWEENQEPKLDIIKFCRKGKWGYKDQKGNVLIQPIYDEAFQFSEDLACVEKDSKLGYINKQGEQVIDFIYDCANSFSDGLACVTKDDKTGYIDKEGKYVFELKYQVGTPFVEGKALIKEDNKWGVLATDGSIYWR